MTLQDLFYILGSLVLLIVIVWNIVLGVFLLKFYKFVEDTSRTISYAKNSIKFSVLSTLLNFLRGSPTHKVYDPGVSDSERR